MQNFRNYVAAMKNASQTKEQQNHDQMVRDYVNNLSPEQVQAMINHPEFVDHPDYAHMGKSKRDLFRTEMPDLPPPPPEAAPPPSRGSQYDLDSHPVQAPVVAQPTIDPRHGQWAADHSQFIYDQIPPPAQPDPATLVPKRYNAGGGAAPVFAPPQNPSPTHTQDEHGFISAAPQAPAPRNPNGFKGIRGLIAPKRA